MKKAKYILLIFLSFIIFSKADAQNYPYWEFGVFGGFSNYQGDLSNGLNDWDTYRNAVGAQGKVHFDETIKLRGGFTFGQVMADDAFSRSAWRRNRNLNFRSNIYELSLVTEIHLFTNPVFNQGFHPYLLAGIAGFNFNPQARLGTEWVDLQPLGTEGQETNYLSNRSKYSLTQIAIPTGVGIEISLGSKWFMYLEFGYRWTITDFLDDVSGYYPDPNEMEISYGENSLNQTMADRRIETESYEVGEGFNRFQRRGDPTNKDRYVFVGVTVSKRLTGILCNTF
ncbi:MAG: outer membrane beta-barrel protein [Bacteroidia bacterium]